MELCLPHLDIMANVVGVLCRRLGEYVALKLGALTLGALLSLAHRLGAPPRLLLLCSIATSTTYARVLAVALLLILPTSHIL